ncbi:hypothetical protein KOR42_14710 [Thalassoglobus neptunius]|uniref:Uncharacterized protein n=1 Tax=Thalassoglobus neptunius TaxID=1938619 RepID=A0A5C5X597_9PLAN|nr:hypothetical protein [Thalassoglobus neptunius]TWT58100.1 hypothetical protein KOR42_14710 [Thalassoglobus neptunius]
MAAVPPTVTTLKSFLSATTPSNIFKRGRGKKLTQIDVCLKTWEQGGKTIPQLVQLIRACRGWLAAKSDSMSARRVSRRQHVKKLANEAFARLQYETFEERKGGGSYDGSLQGMVGHYQHERTTYLASGKQQAVSGSTAAMIMKSGRQMQSPTINGHLDSLGGRTIDQLTTRQFENLVRTCAPNCGEPLEVYFMKKQERLTKLIIIEDGILYCSPTKKYDTGGHQFAYAIDNYGNLFSVDHTRFDATLDPTAQRFNHSSFNAGKDVICAGVMIVDNGRLKYIDNNSGHYKPDKIQVINALRFLRECGVDLFASVKVGVKEMESGHLVMKEYSNAAAFVQNPRIPADKTTRI